MAGFFMTHIPVRHPSGGSAVKNGCPAVFFMRPYQRYATLPYTYAPLKPNGENTEYGIAPLLLFAAITRALGLPEAELPHREPGERQVLSAAARRRIDVLRAWRTEQAERSRLDPAVVLPQRVIDRLAVAGPRTLAELAAVEGVRRWRVGEWGPALLAACA